MENNLIYDVGMNNGDDTAYYLHRGYRVVAVEANPALVRQARQRFQEAIEVGRLIIKQVGIADTEGDLPFWLCGLHTEWSSFHRSIASREDSPHYSIQVPCIRFRSVLEEHGVPYYLKIDIEGYDIHCLNDLTPATAPKYISVEANEIGLLNRLHELGYGRFKCISQFNFLPLELPPSPRQIAFEEATKKAEPLDPFRTWSDWIFNHGSSGPFAEELPGRWQTFEEMRNVFEHYQAAK